MNKKLYFLPILSDALQKADHKPALLNAIEKIKTLGQQSEYKREFQQFKRFMAEVKKFWETHHHSSDNIALGVVRDTALQVAAGLFEDTEKEAKILLDLIASQPGWQAEFEKILIEVSKSEVPPRNSLIMIERNGKDIASILFKGASVTKQIRNIDPGHYVIKFDTGRIIWTGKLTERELLWTAAFPDQALDLAADTGGTVSRKTRQIKLLNGELIIRVYPEIESGRLEVEIKGTGIDSDIDT